MAMEMSTSVLIQIQNGYGNFHVGFDTKAKWLWKFPRRFSDTKAKWPWQFATSFFLAEVQSEH